MNTFTIEIKTALSKVVKVQARDSQHALALIKEQYLAKKITQLAKLNDLS